VGYKIKFFMNLNSPVWLEYKGLNGSWCYEKVGEELDYEAPEK
jgi:hypothetical protein